MPSLIIPLALAPPLVSKVTLLLAEFCPARSLVAVAPSPKTLAITVAKISKALVLVLPNKGWHCGGLNE